MSPHPDGWDWWSEVKLQVLAEYLQGFTRVVRSKSRGAIYLDLFAGSFENDRRHGIGTFPGSTQIALDIEPLFTKLVFFELPGPAGRLRIDIERARPADRRWRIEEGDCNQTLPSALSSLRRVRWAPTFAFLDPRGLQVEWSTVQTLANWRRNKKTKVEQWILMPEPAIARVLGLGGVQGRHSAERLDQLFGCRDWLPIHQGRRSGALTPDDMRAEFVNLYRWRLESVLGYDTTHALQIVATGGQPVYTLIFATDSPPGDAIMGHLYGSAATATIPAMQARARVAQRQRRDDETGAQRLPGVDSFELETAAPKQRTYEHEPPWEPEPIVDDTFELDDEPDIDPDDIKWNNEFDVEN
ncbi:MAG: three-Cys-motif partner protein TcmP [bacterium]|nr:three-Cys-motif partner protein TcmP [bacterium]